MGHIVIMNVFIRLQIVVQLIVSSCVLIATYYRDDVRRHIADLLTSTIRPSRSRDVVILRRRRDVHVLDHPGNPGITLVNGVVRLYNIRRRQYVAVVPRHDVTVTTRRRDVMATPRRLPRRLHSLHFSNHLSCSSCE